MNFKLCMSMLMAMTTIVFGVNSSSPITDQQKPFLSQLSSKLLPSLTDNILEQERLYTQNPQRFFQLDKSLQTPLLKQFNEQAVDIFRTRQLYLKDQKEFLEVLSQGARELGNKDLQNLHPWFQKQTDKEIIWILSKNTQTYAQNIDVIENFIETSSRPQQTFDSVFEMIVKSRILILMSRDERRRQGVILPSTQDTDFEGLTDYYKHISLEAITNFRLFDEMLCVLFPQVSREALNRINELTAEQTLIKQDYALMQFLAREVSIPFDPDTSWKKRDLKGKIKSVYIPDERRYKQFIIPTLPKAYKDIYNLLLNSLEAKKINEDFLPTHIKIFEKQKQKNEKKKGQKITPITANPLAVLPCSVPPIPIEKNIIEKNIPSEFSVSSRSAQEIISPLSLKQTIFKPEGGWSVKDQERNMSAKIKNQNNMVPTNFSGKNVQIKFQPLTPFSLTSGQYNTLQAILSEETPAYTMTFDRVKDLLEAIGIKVERNGGSHAHIYTPGHNIKTLVDIHYGWTNKYGPGTMENLRILMQNLGLNDPKFVKLNQD